MLLRAPGRSSLQCPAGVRSLQPSGRGAVVAALLHVSGLGTLLVHHEREDDRQDARDQEDPPERDVVDEADVELHDPQNQDQAEYQEHQAGLETAVEERAQIREGSAEATDGMPDESPALLGDRLSDVPEERR